MEEKSNDKWILIIEAIDQLNSCETIDHLERVGIYAKLLAQKMNCSSEFIESLEKYSCLHDIGKIGIDRDILEAPRKITDIEFSYVKEHVKIGHNIVVRLNLNKLAENIVLYHHEKWNGKGYPKGLKGEEIPLEARIVSICDVYDALRQKRTYKPSFSHEEAKYIINKENGKEFDPTLVRIFNLCSEKFDEIYNEYQVNNGKMEETL